MAPRHRTFDHLIANVRQQLRARAVLRGIAITLAVAAVSLVLVAVTANWLREKAAALAVLRVLPVVVTGTAAWLFVIRALRHKVAESKIALLIEERSRLENRLITAVEFAENSRDASPAIVNRLIDDAGARSASVDARTIVDPRHSYAFGTASVVLLLLLASMFFVSPAPVADGLAALYSNSGEMVSANATFINVTPGSSRVPRGSDQKIKAGLHGFESSIAQVFTRRLDSDRWIGNPMEPAKAEDEFQFMIFNIQDSVAYYVEAAGIRSPEFTLEVRDLPFVKQIDLVLDYPAYTRLPNKKIENGGEVAALKGTTVSVIAQLSAGAKSARILMSDGAKIEMSASDEKQFTGQFTVKQNGTYRIEITSDGGETYNGSNEYDVTVLEDHPPTVLIDKPGRDLKVTSLQEVFTQARAEDDYGVAAIELYYSVNGGEEKKVQLQDLKSDSPKSLSGAYTFFLEEYGLKPGDFISYYAKARDNGGEAGHESTSDIYFMEVRPFDRNFRQAQQQGGGQGGGDQDSSALTRRQREIIAATFRIQRELAQYTPPEKAENFDAVTLSQEKLKTDTDQLAERIRRRLGEQLSSQPDFARLVECLVQASKEMVGAIAELKGQRTKEALPPEQRALQQLLKAEAIFRDIQVAQGGGQGGGGGSQNAQDLADLFELQLDKMKNQYETVQRQQQAAQDQQQDEIARRLQELARRQQQQIEQRMRSQQQGGGGGGQSQRQQQQMIDEARQMARELERLSRDRRDPKLEETARQLQQAADDMQRAQAQSSSSSGSNSAQASAQEQRALERLQQARRMLDQAGRSGSQQSLQKLRQQAEDALKKQDDISRKVDEIARESKDGPPNMEAARQLGERKDALAEQLSGLEKDIDQTARGLGQDKQGARDKLQAAANGIRSNRLPERIRQNNQLIANGWYDPAREREKIIRGNIDEVLKNLQAAEGSGRASQQGDNLEDALNRARELADNLDSLRRRLESQNGQGQEGRDQRDGQQGQQGQNQQGEEGQQNGQRGQAQGQPSQQQDQAGQQGQSGGRQQAQGSRNQSGRQNQQGRQQNGRQQAGQQQGGQQQGGQQQGGQQQGNQQQSGQQQGGQQQGGRQQGGQQQAGQQAGQQGGQHQGGQQQSGQQSGRGQQASNNGGRAVDASEMNQGGRPFSGGDRQLESELRQRLAEAEELRKRLPRSSELLRDLDRAIEQLRKIDPNVFADPNQLALLKNEVIDPLRQLELELARKLQAKLGNNGPGALSDGDAPDRYRKMIEDYYRRLSVRAPDAKP